MAASLAAGAQITLDDAHKRNEAALQRARDQTAAKQRASDREEVARKLAAQAQTIAAQGARAQIFELDTNRRLLLVERNVRYGSLRSVDISGQVTDLDGNEEAFIVFHFFKDTAYWKYDSDSLFEGETDPFDFFAHVANSAFVDELRKYQMIVGVGLASRTINPVPAIAQKRAALLCGALFARTIGGRQPTTLGLSLGEYVGPEYETRTSPKRTQRSVVIVGVTSASENADERSLIAKVARVVRLDDVELSNYSNIQDGGSLKWVETLECDTPVRR
jgi:hypothetical protein